MSSWSPKLAAFQPPRTPVPRTSGENMVAAMDVFGKTGRVNDMGWLWRGMEYLYYACQYSNRDGWVARYPVAFHGHVTRSRAYNCSASSVTMMLRGSSWFTCIFGQHLSLSQILA